MSSNADLRGDAPRFVRGKGASWRRPSIITKLIILVLLVGVPLGVIVAWSLATQFELDERLARQNAVNHAVAIATRAEILLRDTRSMLRSLAARPSLRSMDPRDCDPFLEHLQATLPRYVSLNTLNLKWEFVCSMGRGSKVLAASANSATYERVKATDDMVLSGPVMGRLSGKRIVVAAYPITDAEGALAGIITAPIDLAVLGQGLIAGELSADAVIEIVDAGGNFIVSHPEGSRIAAAPGGLARAEWEANGAPSEVHADGVERIRAHAPVRGTDWIVTAALPVTTEFASFRERRRVAVAAALIVLFLTGWLAIVFARRITRPLRELERDARVMAAGDFDHRSNVAGPDEVGQLAEAFNDMGLAVQAHEGMSQLAALESKDRQRRLDGIIGSALDAIVTVDEAGLIVGTNAAACRMFGYTAAELDQAAVELILVERFVAGETLSGMPSRRAVRHMTAERMARGFRKDGTEISIEASVSHHEEAGLQYSTAFLRDITERLKADGQIRRLNRVHAVLTGINALIIRAQGREALFQEACRVAVDDGAFRMAWIGVIDPQTLEGGVVALHGGDEKYAQGIRLTARAGKPESGSPACRALRERRPVICNDIATDPALASVRDDLLQRGHRSLGCFPLSSGGRVDGVIALFAGEVGAFDEEETRLLGNLASDISFALDQIHKQERLDYLAYYDTLTGLANRALFLERAGPALREAAGASRQLAVLLIDVERFRNVNDSLGRTSGDALLTQVALWLTRAAGDATLVARLDADHFAALLPDVPDKDVAEEIVLRWLEELRTYPFQLDHAVLRIDAKVGIAMFPADGRSAELLLRNAEAALKKAKAERERYLFHIHAMTESVGGKLTLEHQLRRAVEKGELSVHYLPRMSLASRKLTGAEAVVRWNAAPGSVAADFMPVLEETGLIHEVGRWMLRQVVADGRRWRLAGLPRLRVAINMSARQLRNKDFLRDIAAAVGDDREVAAGLEIEISEGVIVEDVTRNIASLGALRSTGVTVAIDDFGAGFSSLRYLARLPADVLKVDASFISDMTTGPQGLALVSTFIRLAHSLKLRVVAKGVSTEEQVRLLALLGCDEAQGSRIGELQTATAFQARFIGAANEEMPSDLLPPAAGPIALP